MTEQERAQVLAEAAKEGVAVPHPHTDSLMGELKNLVEAWRAKHCLATDRELYYLSALLTGRLNVQIALNEARALAKRDEEG